MKLKIRRMIYMTFVGFILIFSFAPPIYANDADLASGHSKNEVVYVNLSEQGKTEDVYVVNILDVSKSGKIVDYGEYERVKNLTNVEEIKQQGDEVIVDAEEGTFYYQGDLQETTFPWNFQISYFLNGKKMNPEDLVGNDGKLEIQMKVEQSNDRHSHFFEHYMLQITVPFDKERFTQIEAEDATIANVGKEQQVTFTTLPNEEANFVVEAEVNDFEFNGIQIAGVPFAFAFDEFDFSEMEDEMTTLSDAIRQLHDGIGDLQAGISNLNDGTNQLRQDSSQFNRGMNALANSSSKLVAGSAEINQALSGVSNQMKNFDSLELGDFEELQLGIQQLATALDEIATELNSFQTMYDQSFQDLDRAIVSIPNESIEEDKKDKLLKLAQSDADQQTIKELIAYYESAQNVKFTYEQTNEVFGGVNQLLIETSNGISQIVGYMQSMNRELEQSLSSFQSFGEIDKMIAGFEQLAKEYNTFHKGLEVYTGGVSDLASAYEEIDDGIGQLTGGTNELADGSVQLHSGTSELYDNTKEMPETFKERVDAMLEDYDMSDFKPKSFVSEKNKHVEMVQFVFQTEPIKAPEEEVEEEPEKEKKGFWQLIKDLFSFIG